MEESNEEESMVVEELAIVGGRRISVTTSRRISVLSSSSVGSNFAHFNVPAVVDVPTPVEASTSDEEYSSDALSEDEEEEYLPVSSGAQLEIETKEDLPVEEELVVEPIVYETHDRVIPSALVS